MKKNILLKFNIGVVVFLFLLSSCSRSIDGIQMVREKKSHPSESITNRISKHQTNDSKNETHFDSNLQTENQTVGESLTASTDKSISDFNKETVLPLPKINSGKFNLDWSANNLEECDVIVLKTGEEVSAKVTEIGQDEIKYKKCDNLSGPTYSMNKSDVFMIKYSNGTKDIISANNSVPNNTTSNNNNPTEKNNSSSKAVTHWAALVGYICGLVGCFFFGVLLGIAAIIFSAVGLSAIKKNPELYKGKTLAILGIILGIVGIAAWVVVLSLLLSGYYYY